MFWKIVTNCLAFVCAVFVVSRFPEAFGLVRDRHSNFTIRDNAAIYRLVRKQCPQCGEELSIEPKRSKVFYFCTGCRYEILMDDAQDAIYNHYKSKLSKEKGGI